MSARVVLSALVISIAHVGVAHADDPDSGHFSVQVGALAFDEHDAITARALLRAELALRLIGPLAVGGFLQTIVADDPMGAPPGFGGGVLLALRPELPAMGFVPHLEVTGARVQLPAVGQTLADAWALGIGAGAGVAITRELTLEARVQHQWWLGMSPAATSMADHAWTFAAALTVDLP